MGLDNIEARHAERGAPSYVWRAGQQRRLEMFRQWARTTGSYVLVDGCGLGAYAEHLLADSSHIFGFDIEHERVTVAHEHVPNVHAAASEKKPYPANTFDALLSHEVIEHVDDARAAVVDMVRVLRPGGRAIIFCPNRWYPFETHGHYWKGQYHFGNTPFINYLPDRWRDQLAPHVRAYRKRDLLGLLADLPVRVVHHSRIFGAYDNIIARFGSLGRILRTVLHTAERTPLRVFGLSHLLVIEKVD